MGKTMYLTRVLISVAVALSLMMATPSSALAGEDSGAPTATDTEAPDGSTESVTPPEAPDQETPNDPTPETVAPKPTPKGPIPTFTPVRRIKAKRKLVFPIVGVTKYYAGFGDCRDSCTREHFGVDILTYGWKGLPVVAAQDGVVTKVTYDNGKAGCAIRIRGRDRWETRYVHLNNDIPGTDETGYPCPAPGIEVGSTVAAGQIIGWVGDSGNAEHTVPNLHFELRTPGGYPVDPYASLRASNKIVYEWLPLDPAVMSRTLAEANWASSESMAVVIPSTEAAKLSMAGSNMSVSSTPILFVDRADAASTLDEITRMGVSRIVIMSDADATWLEQLAGPYAQIVETTRFPDVVERASLFIPDATQPVTVEHAPPDRFVTIIAGAIDRIRRRKNVTAYDEYVAEHLVLTLNSGRWGLERIGSRSWSKPLRDAERDVLWWNTGDGWVATESFDDVPPSGFAYLTEKRVNPWTLTYLASLSMLPPTPVWWGDGA
ncbi:hypothetical protein MNBD_ACTINO01-1852 [hydrothermal vent metagenome]|uniref:M23ase beta-sheet core domain-containing protein n=1 Tax=hydrothermal vent metagenome TaxID=652676 RepID=A0A3B0RBZ6_9ZZZZ